MGFDIRMLRSRRFLLVALFTIQLFVIYVISLQKTWYEQKLKDAMERLHVLDAEVEYLKSVALPQTGKQISGNSLLSAAELSILRSQGLQDPVKDITTNLIRNRDIIPYPGMAGGRMSFYNARNIYILSGNWVFAVFEDGHVTGKILLEYNIDDNGNISWKVIDSYLD